MAIENQFVLRPNDPLHTVLSWIRSGLVIGLIRLQFLDSIHPSKRHRRPESKERQ